MPEQILKIWQQDYGKAEMLRMAEASLQVRPVYIRIREDITKAEKEKLLTLQSEQHKELTGFNQIERELQTATSNVNSILHGNKITIQKNQSLPFQR